MRYLLLYISMLEFSTNYTLYLIYVSVLLFIAYIDVKTGKAQL